MKWNPDVNELNGNNDNNAHTQPAQQNQHNTTQQYFTNSIDDLTTMKIDARERVILKHEKSTKRRTRMRKEKERESARGEKKSHQTKVKKNKNERIYSIKPGTKVNLGMNRARLWMQKYVCILIFDAASACITSSRLSNMRRYVHLRIFAGIVHQSHYHWWYFCVQFTLLVANIRSSHTTTGISII